MPQDRPITSYEELRLHFLKLNGPFHPNDFFREQMHDPQCDDPAEAKDELDMLRTLHNRAARDSGMLEIKSEQLYYHFVSALPKKLRQTVEVNIGNTRLSPDPFHYAYTTGMANHKQIMENKRLMMAAATLPTPQVDVLEPTTTSPTGGEAQ